MKILAAIISCLLLIGAAVGISVAAEETAPEIEYKNLAYEGAVQIVYYVNTEAAEAKGYTVKLATWTDGEEPVIKSAETFTKFVGETEYSIFTSEGIAPKMMRDTVYAQTILCNSEDGEVDRGEVVEYSIYTYVKNRVAKGSTADQKALYHALVDYGASVQKVLNHNTDKLANDMFMDYTTNTKDISSGTQSAAATNEGATGTRTLYKDTNGTWSTATSEGATEYVFTYVKTATSNVGIDGNSFIFDMCTKITAITADGNATDDVEVNGTVYSVGSVMPRALAGSSDYVNSFFSSFLPNEEIAVPADYETLAVFDTNVVLEGSSTVVLTYNQKKTSGAFFDPTVNLYGDGVNVRFGSTTTSAKLGEMFNLRIVTTKAASYRVDGAMVITAYVNGEQVWSANIAGKTDFIANTKGIDRLTMNVPSDTRDNSVVLTDTTFVHYDDNYNYYKDSSKVYEVNESKMGKTTTTYVTDNGDGTWAAGTEAEHTYAVEWYNAGNAYALEDGSGYVVNKTISIKSIRTKEGADATIEWNGTVYGPGSVLTRTGGTETQFLGLPGFNPWNCPDTKFYPVATVTTTTDLLFVYETDINLTFGQVHYNSAWSGSAPYRVEGSNFTNPTFMLNLQEDTATKSYIGLYLGGGGTGWFDYKIDGAVPTVASPRTGNSKANSTFHIKIEVRANADDSTKVDVLYYIENVLIDTSTVAAFDPSRIDIDMCSQVTDVTVTFTNTKCVKYAKAAE